jgi:FtsZ-interacting cell division protein ZipA
MSELQIGLLAIGALVVAGVLGYNRVQERRARRAAEASFRSGHADVLLGAQAPAREPLIQAPGFEAEPAAAEAVPDAAIDYIVEFASDQPAAAATVQEQWRAIQRRHAPRALLSQAPDRRSWRAGLQLVSRDGAAGEADLIEFRSAVETLAASVNASVSAPEMRSAMEAARALDELCAETDIQIVVHVQGGSSGGGKLRAEAEAAGLRLEDDGRFALRNDRQQLLYTLAASDGSALTEQSLQAAAPGALTLALDIGRTPDARRAFESMARLARHLAAALEGSVVDDNGQPLEERAVAAIAGQLDAVCSRLEAGGIAPGGAAALRLFS